MSGFRLFELFQNYFWYSIVDFLQMRYKSDSILEYVKVIISCSVYINSSWPNFILILNRRFYQNSKRNFLLGPKIKYFAFIVPFPSCMMHFKKLFVIGIIHRYIIWRWTRAQWRYKNYPWEEIIHSLQRHLTFCFATTLSYLHVRLHWLFLASSKTPAKLVT